MLHNHQTNTYPAHKPIPKQVVKGLSPEQKKVVKKQHTKRSRQFNKGSDDA